MIYAQISGKTKLIMNHKAAGYQHCGLVISWSYVGAKSEFFVKCSLAFNGSAEYVYCKSPLASCSRARHCTMFRELVALGAEAFAFRYGASRSASCADVPLLEP